MIIGIDIGGSKTLIGRFADRAGKPKLLNEKRYATEKVFAAELEIMIKSIRELAKGKPISQIVVGSRGEIDNDGRLTDKKIEGWRSVPISQRLQKAFGCPVSIYSDAAMSTLAEAKLGAGKNYQRVLFCTISSGIGTGFTIDRELVLYRSGGGDMVLGQTELGKDSYLNTFEKLMSGSAVKRRYGKYGYQIKDKSTWDEIARGLAVGINNLIVIIQPDIVVIGGGLGVHFGHFQAKLRETLEKSGTSQFPLPVLAQAHFLEDGVIYGCALKAQELKR